MSKSYSFIVVLFLLPLLAFRSAPLQNAGTTDAPTGGWISLFDGQTTKGWHSYRKDYVGNGWKVENGALVLDKGEGQEGGDLVSDMEFENYDLRLEWKIAPCGNSGIIFNAQESSDYQYPWQTGPEMQVLDNSCHPDAKIITHRAGDLYDMISCKEETVLPANEWNSVRIRIKNGKGQFWLNGKKIVKFTMFDEEWAKMIADSKFKDMPGFGTFRKGHLVLQDHGDKVWFRNIRVKEL
ncbi:MAG: DUF1080 domain-containing protein [Saprospiraceae bacterium]|nr:DUF1080 domain-containing protein [Lewinella sp.]